MTETVTHMTQNLKLAKVVDNNQSQCQHVHNIIVDSETQTSEDQQHKDEN